MYLKIVCTQDPRFLLNGKKERDDLANFEK